MSPIIWPWCSMSSQNQGSLHFFLMLPDLSRWAIRAFSQIFCLCLYLAQHTHSCGHFRPCFSYYVPRASFCRCKKSAHYFGSTWKLPIIAATDGNWSHNSSILILAGADYLTNKSNSFAPPGFWNDCFQKTSASVFSTNCSFFDFAVIFLMSYYSDFCLRDLSKVGTQDHRIHWSYGLYPDLLLISHSDRRYSSLVFQIDNKPSILCFSWSSLGSPFSPSILWDFTVWSVVGLTFETTDIHSCYSLSLLFWVNSGSTVIWWRRLSYMFLKHTISHLYSAVGIPLILSIYFSFILGNLRFATSHTLRCCGICCHCPWLYSCLYS